MEPDGSGLDGTNQFVDHAGERGSVGGAVRVKGSVMLRP